MSSYPVMGRPVNLGYHRIEEIDDFDDVEDVDPIDDRRVDSWYVQVDAGDVKILSREQVLDFYRLGVITGQTYVWQKGMQQWLPLSSFVGSSAAPAPGAVTRVAQAQAAPPAARVTQAAPPAARVTQAAPPAARVTQAAPPAARVAPAQAAPPTARVAPAQAAPPAARVAPAQAAPASREVAGATSSDEIWRVLMGPNDVKTWTLEQLDDFFRLGVIDEQTYVWQSGMKEWTRLESLLGSEQDDSQDDFWYALVGPGDVKTLSLEQLDDFYRLDIINERTPLWQPGMAQWLPLGTIAGIEPAAAPPVSTPVASEVRSVPTRVAPASDIPLSYSIAPPEVRRPSWLLRIAIAAGVLITLFRNDVVYSAAQVASQSGSYVQAEQRVLGGPMFGTPRAVESLITDSGGRIAPVRLPYIVTEMQESRSAVAGEKADGSAKKIPTAVAAAVPAANASQAVAPADAHANAAPAAAPNSKPSTPDVAAALAGAKAKPTFATVKPASMPQVKKKRASRGQSVFRADGKGDYYDPLNAAM